MRTRSLAAVLLVLLATIPCLARAQTLLTDFSTVKVGEAPAGWKLRGTNGRVSRFMVQERAGPEGAQRSLLLEYSFEGEFHPGGWLAQEGGRTCIMGCWLPIPADHWVLEVDLEGDGSGHGLVLSVGEEGEWFNYDLGRLDFTRRRTLRLDLRTEWRAGAGPRANQQMEPPLAVASLNLEESPEGPRTGRMTLYAIRALQEEPRGLSALSVGWLRPFAGAFSAEEAPAFRARVRNLGAADFAGEARWRLRSGGRPPEESTDRFEVPAGGEQILTGRLEGVSFGFRTADLTVASLEGTRSYRTTVAVIPTPRPDPSLRLGLGESYPGFAATERFAEWVQTIRALGGSWTLAHLLFTTFDQAGSTAAIEPQHALLEEAAAHGVALVASLGNLPPDLVNTETNEAVVPLEQLVQRYETAMSVAALRLRGQVSRWCLLHLDWSFFPGAEARPQPDYAEFLTRVRAKIAEADPEAGFIAALVDRSVSQWEARGNGQWPAGVDFLTERIFYAGGDPGATHRAAEDLAAWKAKATIGGELWLKSLYPLRVEGPGWGPGRQWAEGVVVKLVETVHAAPRAHALCNVFYGEPEQGSVVDRQGNVTAAGLAFALCADLLNGAEPSGEVTTPTCRGYLFRCDAGTLAVLWPQPGDAEQTVPLQAEGVVEHYGAVQRYPDLSATATNVTLHPGANLLRGRFTLGR